MSEPDDLIKIVQSLAENLKAAGTRSMLRQLLGITLLEAAECLVREGFEAARLNELGVPDDVIYFVDAKYRPSAGGSAVRSMPVRIGPHLRLVGA
jgi:hypothetical protein